MNKNITDLWSSSSTYLLIFQTSKRQVRGKRLFVSNTFFFHSWSQDCPILLKSRSCAITGKTTLFWPHVHWGRCSPRTRISKVAKTFSFQTKCESIAMFNFQQVRRPLVCVERSRWQGQSKIGRFPRFPPNWRSFRINKAGLVSTICHLNDLIHILKEGKFDKIFPLTLSW